MILLWQRFESWQSPCLVGHLELYIKIATTMMGGMEQTEAEVTQEGL